MEGVSVLLSNPDLAKRLSNTSVQNVMWLLSELFHFLSKTLSGGLTKKIHGTGGGVSLSTQSQMCFCVTFDGLMCPSVSSTLITKNFLKCFSCSVAQLGRGLSSPGTTSFKSIIISFWSIK